MSGSLHRRCSVEEKQSSQPSSPLHLAGGEGSPVDLARRTRDFAGSEDSRQVDGDSSRRRPSATVAGPEAEIGTHSSASTEESAAADAYSGGSGDHGGGHGLDGNGRSSMHALVDDDDVDRELDAATKVAPASVGGAKEPGSTEAGGGSIGTTRGGVQDNPDSVAGETGMVAKDDLDNAGNDGEACQNNRKQEGYRSRNSKLTKKGIFAQAGDDDFGKDDQKDFSGRSVFRVQQWGGDYDRNSCSSTELTLGRPDPTSVHWKFSRRLLQT